MGPDSPTTAAGIWETFDDWDQGVEFYDIEIVSANDVWAVGRKKNDSSLLMHYDGSTWHESPSPAAGIIRAVSMVSANEGWAVGGNGTILHYNGSSWSEVDSPTSDALFGVDMVSANEGWAVGDQAILRYNGDSWLYFNNPLSCQLRSVDMVSADEGWVAGITYSYSGRIMHYDGSSWTTSYTTSRSLNDIDMVDASTGWAVGYVYPYPQHDNVYRYNGSQWSRFGSGIPYAVFEGVSMISPQEGFIVGGNGIILRYDGNTWNSMPNPTSSDNTIEAVAAALSGAGQTHLWVVEGFVDRIHHYVGDPIPTATPTSTPSPTPTPTPTPTPEPLSTLVPPEGGSITSNDTNRSTTIQMPSGAVTDTTVITYAYRLPEEVSSLAGIGHFFELFAEQNGVPITTFSEPVTIAVRYTDQERGPVIEESLHLYWLSGTTWITDGIATVAHANSAITSTTNHFTPFAVLGKTNRAYLPIITRSYNSP
jgi:hypothetical protein